MYEYMHAFEGSSFFIFLRTPSSFTCEKKKGFHFLHFSFIANILGCLGYLTIANSLSVGSSPINKSEETIRGNY